MRGCGEGSRPACAGAGRAVRRLAIRRLAIRRLAIRRLAIRRLAMLLPAMLLPAAGCHLGPDYARPQQAVPESYLAAPPGAAAGGWPDAAWWRGFGSPELDALVGLAQAHNQDIAAAVARVVQADAQVRQAGAALLPTLSATGTYQYQRTGYVQGIGSLSSLSGGSAALLGGSTGGSHYEDFRTYTGELTVSYEVDFWGRVRAAAQSARASAVYSRFDAQTTALTVVSNVASTWFNALADRDRLAIAQHNVADAEATLRVIRGRLEVGTANALDVAQEAAQVATQRALVPNLRSQMRQQVIALGILVGAPPEAIPQRYLEAPGTLETLALPAVSAGLPSALLTRRPDVAAAEAQLVAANASVQGARAAFFPQVQLTAAGGLESGAFAALFGPGSLLLQAGASLTQPIFDGGTLRGQLDQAKGRAQELVADYRKAVLQAFTDVDTALTAYRFATEQEALQRAAVTVAQRAADIARAQLLAGTADVTTVLQAQITLYTAEDTLAQVRLLRFQSLLNVFKALGGGWAEGAGPIQDQFPGLSPGLLPGGVALPVGGNVR
jgi:NodT family efflux transporter outer membrane factor (OMF) lipoprotein